MNSPNWIDSIDEKILSFLSTLQVESQYGRFLPCVKGVTEEGGKAALGFSCFALKIYHMLGHWEKLDKYRQREWLQFIKSFQRKVTNTPMASIYENAFIDPVLINYLDPGNKKFSLRVIINSILTKRFLKMEKYSAVEKVILAETKQALSTLDEVGIVSNELYDFFPKTEEEIQKLVIGFDWRFPYDSGAEATIFAVLMVLGSRKSKKIIQEELKKCYATQIGLIANASNGCYYKGQQPKTSQLINGAMKILSGLKWLEEPIHYPKSLIDTCLAYKPATKGCDLVNVAYVLFRCNEEVSYRRKDIRLYCLDLLDMIKQHQKPDGGFSYYIKHSQRSYYGLPISEGLFESDIHGTILLTWALAMILELLDLNKADLKVIKP